MAKAILAGDILDDGSFKVNSGGYPATGISGGIMGNIWGNLYICNIAFQNSGGTAISPNGTLFTLDGIKSTAAVIAPVSSNNRSQMYTIGINANSQTVYINGALPAGYWLFGHIIIPVTRA